MQIETIIAITTALVIGFVIGYLKGKSAGRKEISQLFIKER